MKAVLPDMLASGRGVILNVGSIMGVLGYPEASWLHGSQVRARRAHAGLEPGSVGARHSSARGLSSWFRVADVPFREEPPQVLRCLASPPARSGRTGRPESLRVDS